MFLKILLLLLLDDMFQMSIKSYFAIIFHCYISFIKISLQLLRLLLTKPLPKKNGISQWNFLIIGNFCANPSLQINFILEELVQIIPYQSKTTPLCFNKYLNIVNKSINLFKVF